jgi:hypothetical protein
MAIQKNDNLIAGCYNTIAANLINYPSLIKHLLHNKSLIYANRTNNDALKTGYTIWETFNV